MPDKGTEQKNNHPIQFLEQNLRVKADAHDYTMAPPTEMKKGATRKLFIIRHSSKDSYMG